MLLVVQGSDIQAVCIHPWCNLFKVFGMTWFCNLRALSLSITSGHQKYMTVGVFQTWFYQSRYWWLGLKYCFLHCICHTQIIGSPFSGDLTFCRWWMRCNFQSVNTMQWDVLPRVRKWFSGSLHSPVMWPVCGVWDGMVCNLRAQEVIFRQFAFTRDVVCLWRWNGMVLLLRALSPKHGMVQPYHLGGTTHYINTNIGVRQWYKGNTIHTCDVETSVYGRFPYFFPTS